MASALLIIDVQQGLFAPSPRPADAAAVIARINALAARARVAGVPVVFVQHEGKSLAPDTPAWALAEGLHAEAADHRIRKSASDAFLRTGLSALLDAHAATHLAVCGYASEFCVDSTVRRAAALGYDVTLAADAHTTHDQPHADAALIRAHHNATLSSLGSYGVRIEALPAEQIVFRTRPARA
ncbi:cysteine hydrolase family protein [Bordetella bronchialis]|uniref:cysteine hydrolase family protein n=1 Tax=Bordetella bronchialis TaxID=463025 RepID=UPI003D006406